jgi:hypothetical protein
MNGEEEEEEEEDKPAAVPFRNAGFTRYHAAWP